jgi:hypothetical protein
MQLLVLKILYLLFTTKGTSEYFYTNDLCVLVDVFLRELADLDDESESVCNSFTQLYFNDILISFIRSYGTLISVFFILSSRRRNCGIFRTSGPR